ncbi:MAG: L-rhamnose/proton symporter RhaT [Verrucomicrobia bacterium]|nr:L-rhamnose/proton symporter RhaT [Verrucomicrobiota bacterium]
MNPFLGVVYHWIGGLAAGSFYLPFRGVKKWSWETYWLVNGVFSWILAPLVMASLLVPDALDILRHADSGALGWAYFWGAMWGIGGLTFGLSVRYLGIALGYGIALGFCAAFGTLIPPAYFGELGRIAGETSGRFVLLGVAVCLGGIFASGLAGKSKEGELSAEQKKAHVAEFNFLKGVMVAAFAGVMSACMSFAFAAGKPIAAAAKASLLAHGRSDVWQNLPLLIVILLGGFTTNFFWCVILNVKNRSAREYLDAATPLPLNYILSALAGVTWYLQFFFYGMGTTKMGKYDFSSWTLHMVSIIIFSTLWGVVLKEWRGTSKKTHALIAVGLAVLILSTLIIGYGNFLKARASRDRVN